MFKFAENIEIKTYLTHKTMIRGDKRIIKNTFLVAAILTAGSVASAERYTSYVDPRIGSEGLGRVFIGPATPFGMVRPGPDCTPSPNSGWLPMPERVDGFAQLHVSGTGGGPKYGNILIQPYFGDFSQTHRYAYRDEEKISCGYYSTTYADSHIKTEITTAPRTSAYRIIYPKDENKTPCLLLDAGFFLGETPIPDAREAQQFVGSEIAIESDHQISGYSRIRGGWNNGRAYTVYFHAETDKPFISSATWNGDEIGREKFRTDHGEKTGALVSFSENTDTINLRIGISFISESKAKENLTNDTFGKTFDQILGETIGRWENVLERVTISEKSSESIKRMFYTGLYHTMLMPSDRTGENPLWTDRGEPYYDDFYAIWDTYRTSMPLITLIDPERQAEIVRSLVNIGKRDGYMPDARSGNSNGRTQGGSNADIVIADAYVKGLKGIDYEKAFAEMLKDAEIDPGYEHEAYGRGGITDYNKLGYIPWGTARAGNRTVEYSLCDFALAQVAKGLGKKELAEKYENRSHNWRNLWRAEYEHDGTMGFIMPKSEEGEWLDSLTYGHSENIKPKYKYTPLTFEGPWYRPWWDMFFYEASSWEYSLSMPHDVDLLISSCGGHEVFGRRLNTFFERGYYNVNNEPSFMTPCLYHWIGRPDLSTERIRQIVNENFSDKGDGLPGNDDSGAMSSWLAFHIMGLYPNAAHSYYLINSPMTEESVIHNQNGKPFRITAEGLSDKNRYIASATLNGHPHPYSTIDHKSIEAGGELRLKMASKPLKWGIQMMAGIENPVVEDIQKSAELPVIARPYKAREYSRTDTVSVTYYLHGQKRRFKMEYRHLADGGIDLVWGIERNLKWWEGCYSIDAEAVECGNQLCLVMPEDGNIEILPDNQTFGIISRAALRELESTGKFTLDGIEYAKIEENEDSITARDNAEGAEITILMNPRLPLILKMTGNPLEIDWEVTKYDARKNSIHQ